MSSPSCCLFAILMFSTSTVDATLIENIYKRAAPEEPNGICGGKLIACQDVESFTSTGYPQSYPDNTDCTWSIKTHPGNQIVVNVTSIDVEYDKVCRYDYLVFYDGLDSTFPRVGQYCGKIPPVVFTSTSHDVLVEFHSDQDESWKGFQIEYHAIGDFKNVGEFNVKNRSEKVIDGGVQRGNMRGQDGEKGGYTDVQQQERDGQTVETDGCNQIWQNARHGNITSPGYPDRYPSDANCTIEINAPINSRIDLTFNFFDLEAFCIFDYVIIKDSKVEGAEPIGQYCGHDVLRLIQSSTGQLIINFISDVADEMGGFHATFVSHVCGSGKVEVENMEEYPIDSENESGYQFNGNEDNGSHKHPESANGDSVFQFIIEPTDSLNLQEGDLVRKECDVNKEEGIVLWWMGGKILPAGEETEGIFISEDGRRLLIPSMEAKHEGGFVCESHLSGSPRIITPFALRITNEDSEPPAYEDSVLPVYLDLVLPVYEDSNLPVYEDSSEFSEDYVQFETVPIAANITEGTNHVLLCSTNNKNVELVWDKDGDPLSYNDRIYKIFEANLLVGDAKRGDSGRYSCVAYSKQYPYTTLGEASAYLTVTSSLDVLDVCGIVSAQEVMDNEEDKGRIVNGNKALKGSSPWMARLWSRAKMEHLCAGSLINNRWVVTAAHCLRIITRPDQLEVRLGDHDTLYIEPEEMKFRVSRYILHPDYNDITLDRNIALIELESRVPVFTDYIKPICLPNLRPSEKLLVPGKTARVAGWGKIVEDGAFSRFLKELNLPIIPESSCRASTADLVTDNMFCAGFSQASVGDACDGDSGGPLAQEEDGKWFLTGITSWGEGCAREGKYGFYTKVSEFITWLRETMED